MQPDNNLNQTPPPAEPVSVAPAEPQPMQPAAMTSSKKPSKKLWIGIASAVAVLVIGGVAGAMWWTSPQKTYDDALSLNQPMPKGGAFKTNMEVTPKDGPTIKIDLDTKFTGIKTMTDMSFKVDAGAMNINLTGGVATDVNKSLFFKVNDVRKTLTSFTGGNASAIDSYYGGLIDKIDGKWVEITETDMKDTTKDSGGDLSCMIDAISKITTNKDYYNELSAMYEKNKYISLKDTVGSEKVDGKDSIHYVVAIDQNKLKNFSKASLESQWFKEMKKCSNSEATSAESALESTGETTPKLEIWVDKWSHKVNKIKMSQDQDGTAINLVMYPTYNDNQKVTVPAADTQFKDIQKEMQTIQESLMPTTTEPSMLNSI